MTDCFSCGESDILAKVRLIEFKHHKTRRRIWICEECIEQEGASQGE